MQSLQLGEREQVSIRPVWASCPLAGFLCPHPELLLQALCSYPFIMTRSQASQEHLLFKAAWKHHSGSTQPFLEAL